MQTITDTVRQGFGFLTLADTTALERLGVSVLDPHSTLIAATARLESGIVLWPGTTIQAEEGGIVSIGAGTVLFPGTRLMARAGQVIVGRDTELGDEGGFTIRAEGADVAIWIGERVRLTGNGSLALSNRIGNGAQILGPIQVRNCRLGDGASHRDPDPDLRGGVLKGHGVAHGLDVPTGHVIQAFGLFADAPIRRQSFFHPPPAG